MRTVLLVFFLVLVVPVSAHHTKEHILGAPQPPVPAVANAEPGKYDGASWLALGPFAALATLGVLRWGYRRRQDKNKTTRN